MMLRDYSEDVNNYWKLKAIDSLGVANDDKMPREERTEDNRPHDRQSTNQKNLIFYKFLAIAY